LKEDVASKDERQDKRVGERERERESYLLWTVWETSGGCPRLTRSKAPSFFFCTTDAGGDALCCSLSLSLSPHKDEQIYFHFTPYTSHKTVSSLIFSSFPLFLFSSFCLQGDHHYHHHPSSSSSSSSAIWKVFVVRHCSRLFGPFLRFAKITTANITSLDTSHCPHPPISLLLTNNIIIPLTHSQLTPFLHIEPMDKIN
jgi:hypothetical protein